MSEIVQLAPREAKVWLDSKQNRVEISDSNMEWWFDFSYDALGSVELLCMQLLVFWPVLIYNNSGQTAITEEWTNQTSVGARLATRFIGFWYETTSNRFESLSLPSPSLTCPEWATRCLHDCESIEMKSKIEEIYEQWCIVAGYNSFTEISRGGIAKKTVTVRQLQKTLSQKRCVVSLPTGCCHGACAF